MISNPKLGNKILQLQNILWAWDLQFKDNILKVNIINGLLPIHPAIMKALVILSFWWTKKSCNWWPLSDWELRHQTHLLGLSYPTLLQETYCKMHQCHCQRLTLYPFMLLLDFLGSRDLGGATFGEAMT